MTILVAITLPRPREKLNSWRAFVVRSGKLPHLIACGYQEPVEKAAQEAHAFLAAEWHREPFSPSHFTIGTYHGGMNDFRDEPNTASQRSAA